LLSRNIDNGMSEAIFRLGMSVLAYSPLAAGILAGKYRHGARPAEGRFVLFDDTGLRFRKPIVEEAVEAYAAVAERRGLTLIQLALAFVRSRWFMGATIIGATSVAQLGEDIAAAEVELDADTLADIAAV